MPWSKIAILGMVIQPLTRNPYNGYINPYYWVDDHPLLYENNGSLDPSTYVDMYVDKLKVASPKALEAEETRKRRAELDDQCGRLQILRDRWPVGIESGGHDLGEPLETGNCWKMGIFCSEK